MKKNWGVLIILTILLLISLGLFLAIKNEWLTFGPTKEPTISSGVSTETGLDSEGGYRTTHYTNEEFGFSLNYPSNWALPEEEQITPSQQHLYHITLNPQGEERYYVDIYDQPSPISLRSFVANYFKEIESGPSKIAEAIINGEEAVRFVMRIPSMTGPTGMPHIAFKKGPYVLILSRTAIKAEPEEILRDKILNIIAESFQWVE